MTRLARGVAALALCSSLAAVPAPPVVAPAATDALAPPPQPALASIPDGWPAPPAVSATSYLLLDRQTGQVLAQRNPDQRRAVASTIKVLTAVSVLARTAPDELVTIPPAAAAVGGASVGLDAGETWTVAQLLDGMLVRSGNDAATALAIHVGGGVESFVALMRADAAAMGIPDVAIDSPTGLGDGNRLSARDLATITRVALADPRFRTVVGRRTVILPGQGRQASRNQLLSSYPGATGVKTGFTEAAGYSLVASAVRDGRELVAVGLASRSDGQRFEDAAALLDFGFDAFSVRPVGFDARLRVAGGWVELDAEPVPLATPDDAPGTTPVLPLPIEAPAAGDVLVVPVHWQGQELGELAARVTSPARAGAEGGAAIGRVLADRAYAALRAAATTGTVR